MTKKSSYYALSKIDDIANKKLDELNIVKTEMSFEVRADHHLRIGVKTWIKNKRLNLDDAYRVISSKHIIEGTSEKVHITVVLHEDNVDNQDHILLA